MRRKRETWLILSILIVGTLTLIHGKTTTAPPLSFNCKIVSCPAPQCEYGEHLEVPPGACCPTCVPD
jgi:hypothetical protein